jgi:hypothetical protein
MLPFIFWFIKIRLFYQIEMTKSKKVILKKLKREGEPETLWHPESRLVFKSKKERIVVGRLSEDSQETVVDEMVIDLCGQWKFKIDPTLVESTDEEPEPELEPELEPEPEPEPEPDTKDHDDETPEKNKPTQDSSTSQSSSTSLSSSRPQSKDILELTSPINDKFTGLMYELQDRENQIECLTNALQLEKNKRISLEQKFDSIKKLFS